MEINSSTPWDVDASVEQAIAALPDDRPLRIRIAPQIWLDKGEGEKAQYIAWKRVSWNVAVKTLVEAQSLRTGLQLFFRAAACFGMPGVIERLQTMLRETPQSGMELAVEDEIDES